MSLNVSFPLGMNSTHRSHPFDSPTNRRMKCIDLGKSAYSHILKVGDFYDCRMLPSRPDLVGIKYYTWNNELWETYFRVENFISIEEIREEKLNQIL